MVSKDTPNILKINGTDITNPLDIAEAFNTHFTEVATTYVGINSTSNNLYELKQYINSKLPQGEMFYK